MNRDIEAGWTITELMFTLSILGFLLTLAVPTLSAIGERMEKELFLDVLSADLQLAQMEALSRQEEVSVEVCSGWIEVVQGKKCLRKVMIPKRYKLESNYIGKKIQFRSTGQVVGGTLWLCKDQRHVGQIKIQVSSGRPKVELWCS